MATGVCKTGAVVAARVADNSGNRAPCIGVRGDERAELGSLVVWVEFIVDFFPNEFYGVTSVPVGIKIPTYTCLRGRPQG